MNVNFPVIELVDRYVISKIKHDKTQNNQSEVAYYHEQMSRFDLSTIDDELKGLESIHLAIWDLEKELKSGQEQSLPLEEIGRRAIEIRNLNNRRIALKNYMADKLGCNVREIKKDHLSE